MREQLPSSPSLAANATSGDHGGGQTGSEMLRELGQALGMLVAAVGDAFVQSLSASRQPAPEGPGWQAGHGRWGWDKRNY